MTDVPELNTDFYPLKDAAHWLPGHHIVSAATSQSLCWFCSPWLSMLEGSDSGPVLSSIHLFSLAHLLKSHGSEHHLLYAVTTPNLDL